MIKRIIGYILYLPVALLAILSVSILFVTVSVCVGLHYVIYNLARLFDLTDTWLLRHISDKIICPLCDKFDELFNM